MPTSSPVIASILVALTIIAQAEVILPTKDMVQYGIPTLTRAMTSESDPYRTFLGSSLLGWTASKRELLIKQYDNGSVKVERVAAPGSKGEPMTHFRFSDEETYSAPLGSYLIYSAPASGDFHFQLYRYDIDSNSTTLLTDGKSTNQYPLWSRSGRLLAYSSTRRNGNDMDVYVMDPFKPETNHIVAKLRGEDWAPFAWSPDDKKLVLSDYESSDETYLWLLDIATGSLTRLVPKTGDGMFFNGSAAFFSKDGSGIFFVSDEDSEFRRLSYLDIASGRITVLTPDINWDIDEFCLSPDGKTLAFVVNEDGAGRLHLLDATTYRELRAPELPLGVVSRLVWHPQLPVLAFQFSSTKSPSDVYSVDLTSGKLEQWTKAYNAIDPSNFRDPEIIRWRSFDNTNIAGLLYRPPATFTGKRPVIINVYGGLYTELRPEYRGEDNYFIDRLGVAMIYPNTRGSSGYGKTFMKMDRGPLRVNAIKDVGALLKWIEAQPDLDSSRVLVEGVSYGGYVALSVAEMFPHNLSCVLSYVGVTNLATFIERSQDNKPEIWRREVGDERDPRIRAFLERIAPSNNANKIRKPTFLVLGGKDERTSVSESEKIVGNLRRRGIPVWYLLARDQSHGFSDWEHYDYFFAAKVEFVLRYLIEGTRPHNRGARPEHSNPLLHRTS